MLDGVYRCDTEGEPVFVEVPAPTDEALQTVLHKIITRTMKLLTRKGVLVGEQGQTYMADDDADSEESRVLRPLQAAACTYRIAFGPRAGQKVLTVQGAMPRDADFKKSLCADIDGFSLHAAVRCGADERQGLEQLCRYITRPALANERVQTNAAGQVVLKLKTAWRDGTTHLVPVAAGVHAAAGGAGATATPAPDSLPWRSRTQRQAARAGGAAGARTARAGRTAGQVRGDLCAPPSGSAELGQAAEARIRARHGALPELRRRAEDHRSDPGEAGHREDPHAPGSGGQGAAMRAGPWVAAASGLRSSSQHVSSGPAPRAAGVCCARASQSRGLAHDRPGKPEDSHHG